MTLWSNSYFMMHTATTSATVPKPNAESRKSFDQSHRQLPGRLEKPGIVSKGLDDLGRPGNMFPLLTVVPIASHRSTQRWLLSASATFCGESVQTRDGRAPGEAVRPDCREEWRLSLNPGTGKKPFLR